MALNINCASTKAPAQDEALVEKAASSFLHAQEGCFQTISALKTLLYSPKVTDAIKPEQSLGSLFLGAIHKIVQQHVSS